MTDDQPRPKGRTSRLVLEAILDLVESGRVATRHTICEVTGLRMAIVDERIDHLTDTGKLRRVANGVVEPIDMWPTPRAISATVLPNGLTKFEAGDDVMTLTPHECRLASLLLGGHFNSYHSQALAREFNSIASMNDALLREARRSQARLERRLDEYIGGQQSLPLLDGPSG